jgi:predicted transcriptional regulator
VSEIAKPFSMSMPAVSKHLKVLEGAGLITRGRDAQWRPCKLEAGPLKDAAHWIENYRKFWEASLDRLEDYLNRLQSEPARRSAKPKTRRAKTSKSMEKNHDRK